AGTACPPRARQRKAGAWSSLLRGLQHVAHQLRGPGGLQARLAVEIAEPHPDLGEVVLPPRLGALLETLEPGGEEARLPGLALRDHLLHRAEQLVIAAPGRGEAQPKALHLLAVARLLGRQLRLHLGRAGAAAEPEGEAARLVAHLGAAQHEPPPDP